MARIQFKTTKSENSQLNIPKLEQYFILCGMSDYNRHQTIKVIKMLSRMYSTVTPSQEFGELVYADMVKANKSSNYIRNVMKTIELWAGGQGNKIELPRPKSDGHRTDYLRPDEARALLNAAADIHEKVILAVALWAGLRQKEMINCNVRDWDSRTRLLWVRRNNDPDIKYKGVKNHREESVVIPDECAMILDEYIENRPVVDTKALFITRDGKRFSARGIDDLVRRCGKRADIQRPVSCHRLRHTMITLYCAAGANLGFVSRQARHSSILITQEIYNHSSADTGMLKTAIENTAKIAF